MMKIGLLVGDSFCGVGDFQRNLYERWKVVDNNITFISSVWDKKDMDVLIISLPMLDLRYRIFLGLELLLIKVLHHRKIVLLIHEYSRVKLIRRFQIILLALIADKIGYFKDVGLTDQVHVFRGKSTELTYIGPNLVFERIIPEVKCRKIGYFGHVYRSKRIEEILEFLCGNVDYTLEIVGNILDDKYLLELEIYIDNNRLNDRVMFHGSMSKSEAELVLNECDFFVQWNAYPWAERNGSVLALVGLGRPIFVRKNPSVNALRNLKIPVFEIENLKDILNYEISSMWVNSGMVYDGHLWEKVIEQTNTLLSEG